MLQFLDVYIIVYTIFGIQISRYYMYMYVQCIFSLHTELLQFCFYANTWQNL